MKTQLVETVETIRTMKPIPDLTEAEIQRFWLKAPIQGPQECWPWVGPVSKAQGFVYGVFCLFRNGKRSFYKPHRIAWKLMRGSIDDRLTIDHTCENKLCMNPDHMEQVTQGVNVQRSFIRRPARQRGQFCRYGHKQDPTKRECGQCRSERQANYRKNNPEKCRLRAADYYQRKGKAQKRAAWEKFKAEYHAMQPPPDEDSGYAS